MHAGLWLARRSGQHGAYGELAGGGGDVDGVLLLTGRVQVHLVGLPFAPQLLQGQSHCQVLGQVINRGIARGLDVPAAATQIIDNEQQQLWEKPSATPQVLKVSCEKAFRDNSQMKLCTDLHTSQKDVSSAEKAKKRHEETPENYSML